MVLRGLCPHQIYCDNNYWNTYETKYGFNAICFQKTNKHFFGFHSIFRWSGKKQLFSMAGLELIEGIKAEQAKSAAQADIFVKSVDSFSLHKNLIFVFFCPDLFEMSKFPKIFSVYTMQIQENVTVLFVNPTVEWNWVVMKRYRTCTWRSCATKSETPIVVGPLNCRLKRTQKPTIDISQTYLDSIIIITSII